MKLANYIVDSKVRAGLVQDSKIYPIPDKTGVVFSNVDQILSTGSLDFVKSNVSQISKQSGTALNTVKLAPPVQFPEKIYCAAVNYLSHSKEQNQSPPTEPYFFTKFRNALIGPGDSVLLPKISKKVDWEVELAVVIGKKGKDIRRENAMDHVAGYTISNDISFRDLQLPDKANYLGMNWVRGKGLDTALPLGPWLVTKDEIPEIYSSEISLSVNGIERQKSKIGDMVFKIDQLIEYVSTDITLVPGDVISTGTPFGVAVFTGAPFLKAGDVLEAKIEGIGVLRNYVAPSD
ncbi:MAG TPA: fumarylacetoacetate hydrolase family protein [Nitrososphaerales archaeon]|nr:fumarylacetoacetate hydrolase family protein [Nitrososphaerales archaeon]